MRFIVTKLQHTEENGNWKELYRIPLDLFIAIFWLTPKAILSEIFGKEDHDDHHDQPIDDKPGWQQLGAGWPVGLERRYFEAASTFQDMRWHAVDGYQFRLQESFPALEELYFEGKNVFKLDSGIVGQAICFRGNSEDCPLVFVNTTTKGITHILDLEGVARIEIKDNIIKVQMPTEQWSVEIG